MPEETSKTAQKNYVGLGESYVGRRETILWCGGKQIITWT